MTHHHYLLLAYRDENQWATLTPTERAAFQQACLAAEQELQQNGHLFMAEARPTSHTALTLRLLNGRLTLTNGPLTGTNQPPLDLYFIQARDLNEAIHLAAQLPHAHHGPLEIRPLLLTSPPFLSALAIDN
jgi:hypothetical protein